MNRTVHRLCIWSIVPALALVGVGLLLAGMVPPRDPDDTAVQVAAFYADDRVRIQLGLITAMFACGLLSPFVAAMAWAVHRAAGARGQLAGYLQLVCGVFFLLGLLIPFIVLMAAAFRDDRGSDALLALHDLGWLMFIAPVSIVLVMIFQIGVVALLDGRPEPTFPRWFGYLSIFIALDFIGGGFCVLTRTGPFAWDGAFAYWVPLGTTFPWIGLLTYFLLKDADREWSTL